MAISDYYRWRQQFLAKAGAVEIETMAEIHDWELFVSSSDYRDDFFAKVLKSAPSKDALPVYFDVGVGHFGGASCKIRWIERASGGN